MWRICITLVDISASVPLVAKLITQEGKNDVPGRRCWFWHNETKSSMGSLSQISLSLHVLCLKVDYLIVVPVDSFGIACTA